MLVLSGRFILRDLFKVFLGEEADIVGQDTMQERKYLSRTEPSFATSPFRCVITAMAEVCGSN
jgi:hypothetical protein